MNRNRVVMTFVLGLGLAGTVGLSRAIASTPNTSYNCLTREVWSPEKEEACRETTPSSVEDQVEELTVAVTVEDLIGTEWQLEALNGASVSDTIQTTLTIESSDRLTGKGGCNGYFVEMTADGNTVSLSPIAATMAMCESAVMEQESQFFQVLQAATRFEQSGTSLLIYSDASDQPLQFSAVASESSTSDLIESLIGTEWLLEDLNGTGVMDNVQTTLRFESSDRIVGSGGCNSYFGGLTVEGDRINFGDIGSTRMACPDAVMDQEFRFFQALSTASHIEQDGSYLLIYSEGADQPLRFTQMTVSTAE